MSKPQSLPTERCSQRLLELRASVAAETAPDWLGEQVRRLILRVIGFLLKVIAGLQQKGPTAAVGREHSRVATAGVAGRLGGGAAAACWSPASAAMTGTGACAGARRPAARHAVAHSRAGTADVAERSDAAATGWIPACAGMTGNLQRARAVAPEVTRRASGRGAAIHRTFQKCDFAALPSHARFITL